MAGFEKISCDWSEPCFLNYSVKECWGDNWFTLPLDVFSTRPAAEDVDYSIAELEHLISGAGVPVPWEELIPARTALRASMIEALEECRQRLDLVSRPFVKTTLAKVLDLGPDAVAFYVAFTRDADGHSRTRMRAHTFRHVDGERLWFEYRLPILLRPERVLATAQELLAKLPRRFDRDLWLSKMGQFSSWAVETITPADPGASWSGRKAVSFVVGLPTHRWASVFERKAILGIERRGDWVVVATKHRDRDSGRVFLKCAPGQAPVVEEDVLGGRRLEFKEGKDLLGLAEFSPAFERRTESADFGQVFTWKVLGEELMPFLPFPHAKCVPDEVSLDGRRIYAVVPSTRVPFLHPGYPEAGCLRLVPFEEDFVLVYPWEVWEGRKVPLPRRLGALNSVTTRRGRARFQDMTAAATLLQRVAVDDASGEIDIIVKAVEQNCSFRRVLSPVEARGAFGEGWRNLDVLGLHLAVHSVVKSVVLVPETPLSE
jgi:hypothetical protein